MSTVTATISINAAFFHDIKEDNVRLRQLLDAVRLVGAGDDSASANCRALAALLPELRDQLSLHFSLEEAFGYFEDAVEAAPRLAQRAESLRREHHDLYVESCRLADAAEARRLGVVDPRNVARLLVWAHAFADRIRAHEERENELIVEANNRDIGACD